MTLNFQSQFAAAVQTGQKRSTIRAPRLDGKVPSIGETLHFFTGMRTKKCIRIGEAKCTSVSRVTVCESSIIINRETAPAHMNDWLAQRDGFRNYHEMAQWFQTTHGLPFTGNLIEW